MDSDYTTILKLDEDFKNGLGIINPFIAGLRTQNFVRLCRLWIDKLIHCAPYERQLRNVYLEQLCRHSQQQVLGTPFNCPPNEGPLQVIPQQFLIRQGVSLAKHQPSKHQLRAQQQMDDTTSWSDVSESCRSLSTWRTEICEEYPDNIPIKKSASSTVSTTGAETACTENTHRIRFKHHSVSSTYLKRKTPKKIKKRTCLDSNDELPFKDCYEHPIRLRSVACKPKFLKKPRRIARAESRLRTAIFKEESKLNYKQIKKKASKTKNLELVDDELKETICVEEKGSGEEKGSKTPKGSVGKNDSDSNSKDKIEEIFSIEKIMQIENNDNKKINELEKEVSCLKNENQSLLEQFVTEKEKNEQLTLQLDSVKNEIVNLKNKLILVEKMKKALEEEHMAIINGFQETLTALTNRVDSAIEVNDKVESIIKKLNNDTEITIQVFQKELAARCKALEQEYEDKLSETKKAHSHSVQNYESSINKLKKELIYKNKDKLKLEKKLQEKCAEMRAEVENIKQDIERSSKENEVHLTAKINAYKTKIIRLIKHNQKTIELYEQKIIALNKTKDMELWVQKVNVGSALRNSKKQELEHIISSLEEKFRKQLNDANQRTYSFNEQKHKYEEIASELGSDKGYKSELGSDKGYKSEESKDGDVQ